MTRLGQSTLSDDERISEAKLLINELSSNTECMRYNERKFVEDMFDKMDRQGFFVTASQLFWLRDLREKYCL